MPRENILYLNFFDDRLHVLKPENLGLVTSCASGILVNSGHLLENLVFSALRRLSPHIHYFKTKSGAEVDFVVQLRDSSRMLVKVCESLAEPQSRKREVAALAEGMTELGIQYGTIVTRGEEEEIEIDGGKIEVVAAWRFLLNLPEAQESIIG